MVPEMLGDSLLVDEAPSSLVSVEAISLGFNKYFLEKSKFRNPS